MEKDRVKGKEEDGKEGGRRTEGRGETGGREEKDGMEVEKDWDTKDRAGGAGKLGINPTNAERNGSKEWTSRTETEKKIRLKNVEEFGLLEESRKLKKGKTSACTVAAL